MYDILDLPTSEGNTTKTHEHSLILWHYVAQQDTGKW